MNWKSFFSLKLTAIEQIPVHHACKVVTAVGGKSSSSDKAAAVDGKKLN